MYHIKKKLLKLYTNEEKNFIYTKSKGSIITKDLFGKCIIVYNGKKWLKKNIDNSYLLNKSIGLLKNLETKKISIYKKKKNKKKN
jgi:ribosomal protein S19